MSKAVLVMDMPRCCDECSVICEQYYSAVKNESFNNNMKPNNCPLREVPQKKDETKSDWFYEQMVSAYAQGYNKCIDEILGE